MAIQWFPGHMNAAKKKAAETMKTTDLVIEVLDARIPQASANPMVDELRKHRQRPCLKILNKSDLADPIATQEWLDFYNAQPGVTAIALTTHEPAQVAKISTVCKTLAPHRAQPTKPLRMMIMGIPNVGKSTLMNALLKKRVAKVGDEPAVTKSQQRLYLGKDIVLTDTPGMLWPKITYPTDGLMLAICHAVGVNALIEEEIAVFLAEQLLAHYPQTLRARYGIDAGTLDAVGVLEAIAQKRSLKMRGGDFDIEKAAHALLQDFRSGALGRISLETPARRAELLKHQPAPSSDALRPEPDDSDVE